MLFVPIFRVKRNSTNQRLYRCAADSSFIAGRRRFFFARHGSIGAGHWNFLAGVWLFKNWQRLAVQRGRAPKLNVLEVRSLGGRHTIYVVGYEQERFLISSSPGGVNLLSHLPAATEADKGSATPLPPTFTQALSQVLKGK